MGFESLPKKSGLKEAITGAAALMSAQALEAEGLPYDYSQDYQIETSSAPHSSEQDISKEIESTGEDFDEDTEEWGEDEEIEWVNWAEEPTPASFTESIAPEQLMVYEEGVGRLREFAQSDINEHAAYVLVFPDGRVSWSDRDIEARLSYGNATEGGGQIIVPEGLPDEVYEQVAQEGAKLVKLHSHPTKQFSDETSSERHKVGARDVPPSNTDILSILYESNYVTSSVEGQVITEAGGWRYGFKSKEAEQMFNRVLALGTETLNQEHEPRVITQAELFSQALAVKLLEARADRTMVEILSSFSGEEIMKKLADDPKFFGAFAEVTTVDGNVFSQEELDGLGVTDFLEIIKSISEERHNYLEERGIKADFGSLLLHPPYIGQTEHYIREWAELGVYMEKLEK